MNLIDRYVNDVCRRLPKAQRTDVRRELRSTLADALEGRVTGEPTEDDLVDLLRELGPPEEVANSYLGDRHLIGPNLYPHFLKVLRIVWTVLAGVLTAGFAVALVAGSGDAGLASRLAGLAQGIFETFITSLGIIVVIFAILERSETSVEEEETKLWNPRALPMVREADLVPRAEAVAGVVFPAIILVLLYAFADHVGIIVNPDGKFLLNDVYRDNLPWLATSLLLAMSVSVWHLGSGRWNLPSRLAKIVFDLFGVWVLYRISQGVVGASADLLAAGIPDRLIALIEKAAFYLPFGVALLVVIGGVVSLYRGFHFNQRE